MAQRATRARPRRARAEPPAFVDPELATLVDAAPEDAAWIYETKYDGYRCLLAIGGGRAICYTRRGHDWTDRFGSLVEPARALPVESALLDGEVVVLDEAGRSSFALMQGALKTAAPLVYVAFDLLWLDGEDLRDLPLLERKRRLRGILGRRRTGQLRFSEHLEGRGAAILERLCGAGFEGIVAKRGDAPYRSGRGRDWLKIKCTRRQEFVIGGWSPSQHGRSFGSLLIGYFERGRLVYAGRVGTGFDAARLSSLGTALARLERADCPFEAVPRSVARDARWVQPKLVAEVDFTELTRDGLVRHGAFVGLRGDKPARAARIERPRRVSREMRHE
jgi:bifunctional non-homologous end joining protein LigD